MGYANVADRLPGGARRRRASALRSGSGSRALHSNRGSVQDRMAEGRHSRMGGTGRGTASQLPGALRRPRLQPCVVPGRCGAGNPLSTTCPAELPEAVGLWDQDQGLRLARPGGTVRR